MMIRCYQILYFHSRKEAKITISWLQNGGFFPMVQFLNRKYCDMLSLDKWENSDLPEAL